MLRATGYILNNFLQDFKHEKFPATGWSHGRVGFHALSFTLRVGLQKACYCMKADKLCLLVNKMPLIFVLAI